MLRSAKQVHPIPPHLSFTPKDDKPLHVLIAPTDMHGVRFSQALLDEKGIRTTIERSEKYGLMAILEDGPHPLNARFGSTLPEGFRMGFAVEDCRIEPWNPNGLFDFGERIIVAPPAQLQMPHLVHPMTAHEMAHVHIGEGDVKYHFSEPDLGFMPEMVRSFFGSTLQSATIERNFKEGYLEPGFLEGELEAARVECLSSLDSMKRILTGDPFHADNTVLCARLYHLLHHGNVYQNGILRLGAFMRLQQVAVDAISDDQTRLVVKPDENVTNCDVHTSASDESALLRLRFHEEPFARRLRPAAPYVADRLKEEGVLPEDLPSDDQQHHFGYLLTAWHVIRHDMLGAYGKVFERLSRTVPVAEWMYKLSILLSDGMTNSYRPKGYEERDGIAYRYNDLRRSMLGPLDDLVPNFDPFRECQNLSALTPGTLRSFPLVRS